MDGTGWEPIAAAVRELRLDLEKVVDASVAAVVAEARGYRDLPEEGLRSAVRRNQLLVLDAIEDGRAFVPDELLTITSTIEERARGGIPLEDVLSGFAAAGEAVWTLLHDSALARGVPPALLLEAAQLRARLLSQTFTAAAAAHRRGELAADREAQERQAQVLRSLLRGAIPPEELGEHLARIGLTPGAATHVVRARATTDLPSDRLLELLAGGRPEPPHAVLTLWGEDVVGLLAHEPSHDDRLVAGVAGPVSVDRAADAWVEASRIFEAAVAYGRTGVQHARDLGLLLLVAHEPMARDVLIQRYVAPLRGAEGMAQELLRTVQTLLESHNRRDLAGEKLHLHPNTVGYRVGRFCHFTGVDLEDHTTLAELWWLFRELEIRPLRADEASRVPPATPAVGAATRRTAPARTRAQVAD